MQSEFEWDSVITCWQRCDKYIRTELSSVFLSARRTSCDILYHELWPIGNVSWISFWNLVRPIDTARTTHAWLSIYVCDSSSIHKHHSKIWQLVRKKIQIKRCRLDQYCNQARLVKNNIILYVLTSRAYTWRFINYWYDAQRTISFNIPRRCWRVVDEIWIKGLYT